MYYFLEICVQVGFRVGTAKAVHIYEEANRTLANGASSSDSDIGVDAICGAVDLDDVEKPLRSSRLSFLAVRAFACVCWPRTGK